MGFPRSGRRPGPHEELTGHNTLLRTEARTMGLVDSRFCQATVGGAYLSHRN
jgi:hypothetical protein